MVAWQSKHLTNLWTSLCDISEIVGLWSVWSMRFLDSAAAAESSLAFLLMHVGLGDSSMATKDDWEYANWIRYNGGPITLIGRPVCIREGTGGSILIDGEARLNANQRLGTRCLITAGGGGGERRVQGTQRNETRWLIPVRLNVLIQLPISGSFESSWNCGIPATRSIGIIASNKYQVQEDRQWSRML